MNNGIYSAYSGLKAQMDALDALANNLANINTTGFKEEKTFFSVMNRILNSSEASEGLSKVNEGELVAALGSLNLSPGSLLVTKRDLDVALSGNAFLSVQTPNGVRYTRNGNLRTNSESVLTTSEGFPVLGERGIIKIGNGRVDFRSTGDINLEGVPVDRLKIVNIENSAKMVREGSSLLAISPEVQLPTAAVDFEVHQGFLEQSNVNPVKATVRMVEILRHFESIQKSLNLMVNVMDSKSIDKLGR